VSCGLLQRLRETGYGVLLPPRFFFLFFFVVFGVFAPLDVLCSTDNLRWCLLQTFLIPYCSLFMGLLFRFPGRPFSPLRRRTLHTPCRRDDTPTLYKFFSRA